jgi:hypothetical protein
MEENQKVEHPLYAIFHSITHQLTSPFIAPYSQDPHHVNFIQASLISYTNE